MPIELKPTDLKLLAYLYHNAREPLTQIARELHLSREQIDYRIKKFEQEGIIRGYIPIVNYSKFGYPRLSILFLKFRKSSFIEEFKKLYKNDKNRILHGEILSQYDIFSIFVFENEKERNEKIFSLLEENPEINDYIIVEPFYTELYPLKFTGQKEKISHLMVDYVRKLIKIDDKDKKILKILNKNARAQIIDVAKQAGISAELIVYKLKKLRDSSAWLGARAYFDMEKLGYFYTLVFLHFNHLSNKIQEKIKLFAKNSKNIDSLAFTLGNPNCYLQFFHKDVKTLHDGLKELKSFFKEENIDIKILPLKNEGEDINSLPFL